MPGAGDLARDLLEGFVEVAVGLGGGVIVEGGEFVDIREGDGVAGDSIIDRRAEGEVKNYGTIAI